jgi:serine O-acetyltransferase
MDDPVCWQNPDWSRERPRRFWDPGRKLLLCIRKYQKIKAGSGVGVRWRGKYHVLFHRFWSVVTGADIPLSTRIGGGLLIPHPNGIVIHPDSIIGQNCLIFQQVTLAGAVTLGYHVDIGAGAKILGPLVIGNNVKIGANAVVTKGIPSNATVAGNPAKIITQLSGSGLSDPQFVL